MLQALRTNDGKRLALLWLTLALFAQWFATPAHALSQQVVDRAAAGTDPIAAAVLSLCLPSQLGEDGEEGTGAQGNECQACHGNGACLSAACAALCTVNTASLLLHKIQQRDQAATLYLQHKAARAPPIGS